VLKHGRLRLLTDATGAIGLDRPSAGLYAGDTRFLSTLELLIDGFRPAASAGLPADDWADQDVIALSVGIEPPIRVERHRRLGLDLAEEVELAAVGELAGPTAVRLRLGFDAADIFEIRGYPRQAWGELLPARVDGAHVRLAYLGLDSRLRTLDLRFDPEPSRPITIATDTRGRELVAAIEWDVSLGAGEAARLGWTIEPAEVEIAGRPAALAEVAARAWLPVRLPRVAASPLTTGVEITVDDLATQRVLDRALADLELLTEEDPGSGQRIIAAGLPWFSALFGRDSLITAYEAIAFRPDLVVDALTVLADLQAGASDHHGGEPGQVLHELRTGEMARAGEVPFGPSFGSVDATPLWLVLLAEANDWLDDGALVERLWPAAVRALDWIDARIRRDPAGFLRYDGHPGALANEGWKDSPDSVRDHRGAIVPPPIALAEVQGYVYDGWRRLGRLAARRGDSRLAARLNRKAARLRAAFGAAFWSPRRGLLPMAIGRDGRLADALASNIGQCLWTGVLDRARAAMVASRMLTADLDSGWGIRTMAASEPAFDPLGYHTGSVWPHDTAVIAGGLKRAGFDEGAQRIADELLEAAALLPAGRLPELISGARRTPDRGPELVPGACTIQAWASAAPLHLVRVLLGLEPAASARRLGLRRPHLPGAVDSLTLRGLAVGSERLDLEVRRSRRGVRARVIGGRSSVELVRLG
jgi:glycogen debranching enzyme